MTTITERRIESLIVYTLLFVGAVISLFPFWYMLVTSLKPQSFIFELPPRLWPAEITLQNYARALTRGRFGRYFVNSAVVAVATTTGTVVCASLLSYALARIDFPTRRFLFLLVILGLMIPPVMLIIPQFVVVRSIGLLDKLPGLVVVYVAMNLPMQTFLMRGFLIGIPADLEESAFIDGASRLQVWWKIMLPLSRPALAVISIFSFVYAWDEFAWAHVAIRSAARRTLPIAIAFFQTQYRTEWGIVFAASIVSLVPIFLVFMRFQRLFIEGISTTGLKG